MGCGDTEFSAAPPMSSHQLCEGQEAGMVAEGPSAPDHCSAIQAGPPDQGIGKQFRSVIPRGLAQSQLLQFFQRFHKHLIACIKSLSI